MPNLSKKKVIPIHAGWNFSLESKSLLRLHKHGLLRLFKMEAYNKSKPFHSTTFFSSLVESNLYQELFFDHFSQFVKGMHGPFLIKNIKAAHFSKESNKFFVQDFLQLVSSPKWGCPVISISALEKVKILLAHIVKESILIYSLNKCRPFNASSNEAKIYEHEWSHNLTSFYEYILYNPNLKVAYVLILTYE